jgi:hypothetical protein
MAKIEIEVDEELVDQLSESFFWEEFRDRPASPEDEHARALIVARVNGLSVKIWADEHPPPHFHVSYQDQDASFSILNCARLPGVNGLERYDRIIGEWWRENQKLLIEKWNASRPTNCPVGPITLRSRKT